MITTYLIAALLATCIYCSIAQWNMTIQYEQSFPAVQLGLDLIRTNESRLILNGRASLPAQFTRFVNVYADDAISGSHKSLLEINGTGNNTLTVGSGTCSPGPCNTGELEFLHHFNTEQNYMEGWETTGATTTIKFRAKWFKNSSKTSSPDAKQVIHRIYHRTAGGTETLLVTIQTSILALENVYENRTLNITIPAQAFAADERLVLETWGKFLLFF